MKPKIKTKLPEIVDQTTGSTLIKSVEAFSKIVKRVIEIISPKIIRYGRSLFLFPTELPIITGSKGSTQGAKIVNTPAKKDRKNKVINDV